MNEASNTIELATELTVAWLENTHTRATTADVPAFLQAMYDTLKTLDSPEVTASNHTDDSEQHMPAVSVRKSLSSPDYILSMIDGKPYRALRRHLASNGLSPEEYRKRYNLKADYPMVAPTYSEIRRAMAKTIGLGRRPRNGAASEG